eukprot:1517350-Pleurochrysis_carterae.AAC.1
MKGSGVCRTTAARVLPFLLRRAALRLRCAGSGLGDAEARGVCAAVHRASGSGSIRCGTPRRRRRCSRRSGAPPLRRLQRVCTRGLGGGAQGRIAGRRCVDGDAPG